MPSWHAYYQIADAAERSVSPTSLAALGGQCLAGARTSVQGGNANSIKCKPSRAPERPSSRLGSALAIFSVPGPPWPRRDGGASFSLEPRLILRRCAIVARLPGPCAVMVSNYVSPVCVTAPEFRRIVCLEDARKNVDLTQHIVIACVRGEFCYVRRYQATASLQGLSTQQTSVARSRQRR
jgi:hypothetical protein